MTVRRTRLSACSWLRGWERVLLAVLLVGAGILIAFNTYVAVIKYLRSQRSPSFVFSSEKLSVFPEFEILLCPSDWRVGNFSTLQCTFGSYVTGTLVEESTGPCAATTVTPGDQLECAVVAVTVFGVKRVPPPFVRVVGALAVCASDAFGCSSTPAYMTIAPTGTIRALLAGVDVTVPGASLAFVASLIDNGGAVVLPTGTASSVSLSSDRHVDLHKRHTRTIRASVTGVSPLPNVTFGLTINPFSFNLKEDVTTEVRAFDAWDGLASIAAVSSLAWSVVMFLFPNRAIVPRHFVLSPFRKRTLVVGDGAGVGSAGGVTLSSACDGETSAETN